MGSFNPLIKFDLQKEKKEDESSESKIKEFKTNVISAVDEILDEFERLTEEINKYVQPYFLKNNHPRPQIILTQGKSSLPMETHTQSEASCSRQQRKSNNSLTLNESQELRSHCCPE